MNNSLRDPFNLRRNLITNGAPTAANALTQLNLLRATATQVATQVTEKVTETAVEAIERGKQAVEDINQNLREREREQRERYKEKKDDDADDCDYNYDSGGKSPDEDMSFTVPKNVPSFTNPQRALEDHLWASSGVTARSGGHRGGGGVGGGIIGEGLEKVGGFINPNRGAGLPMYKDKPYAYPHSSRSRPFYRKKRCMAWFLLMVVAVAWLFGFFGQDKYNRISSIKTSDWLKAEKNTPSAKVDWLDRREKVVGAFELSWDAYKRYAWGML